jgi:hypothetical protein
VRYPPGWWADQPTSPVVTKRTHASWSSRESATASGVGFSPMSWMPTGLSSVPSGCGASSSRAAWASSSVKVRGLGVGDAAEHRVGPAMPKQGLEKLGDRPHPRDVLRLTLAEMLPLHADARATSRMSAAYVLEALHDETVHEQARRGLVQGRALVEQLIRQAIADGHIDSGRDPATETNLLLALTGFTSLIELDVIEPQDALAAIDVHLDRLFRST